MRTEVENYTVTHHTQVLGTYPWWRLIRRFRAWRYERRRQREWDALDPVVQEAVLRHGRELERAALFGPHTTIMGDSRGGISSVRSTPQDDGTIHVEQIPWRGKLRWPDGLPGIDPADMGFRPDE